MIRIASLTVASLLLTAGVAGAQTAPAAQAGAAAPTVGATVYGSDGAALGTIDSVTADAAVLNTGTSKVAVPLTSIGKGAKGAAMAMTKQQFDAATQQQQQQQQAALQSKLTAGTSVVGLNGATLGSIKAADSQFVTLTTASGQDVKLPITGFSTNAQGQVVAGVTAAQLQQATAGAATTTTSSTTTTSTAPTGTATATSTAPATDAAAVPQTDAAAATDTSTQTTTTSKTTKKTKTKR